MKLLPLFLLVLLAACNSTQTEQPAKPDPAVLASEVKAIIEEKNAFITAAYERGDIDAAAEHFADNVVQMPPNVPAIRGIENYKEVWKGNASMGTWDMDLVVQDVIVFGDHAAELGSYKLGFDANEDAPFPDMTDFGNYIAVWKKIDGEWKILWDAPSSEMSVQDMMKMFMGSPEGATNN